VQLKNQYDGANVKFKVYPEGADENSARPLAVIYGTNKDNKANASWTLDFEYEMPRVESQIVKFYRDRLGIDINERLARYYINNHEEPYENPYKKKTKFFFTAESFGCKKVKSDFVEIGDQINILFVDQFGKPMQNVEYELIGPDGKKTSGKTSSNGELKKPSEILGLHKIQIKYEKNRK